jgi:hypothetical protein
MGRDSMKSVMPIVIIVAGILVAACLVAGGAAFFLLPMRDATLTPIPTRASVQPGFDGALEGTWQQRTGGFTGVEVNSDGTLGEKWPPGSVVELKLEAQAYRLTIVEASGSGMNASKKLVREEGQWSREGDALMLTPAKGLHVTRENAERREHAFTVTPPRRYRLETRVLETDGPPGASPVTTEALRLVGPCVPDGSECVWDFDLD